MCRIAAYFGPPVRLSTLLTEAKHGLQDQSRNACEMADGHVAGDGWGVGWFSTEASVSTPGLLKSILPMWSDENAKNFPHAVLSGSIVGHIRFASPSVEACFTNTPVYVLDDHLWTINGELQPWPGPLSKAIRDRLDPDHEANVKGSTDGEMLGALWRTHLRRAGGHDAAGALRTTLQVARDLAFERDGHIKTNVIIGHASGLLAARYAEPDEPNTLYTLEANSGRWKGGYVIASEPLDENPSWREVPPTTLVRVDHTGLRTEPLFR